MSTEVRAISTIRLNPAFVAASFGPLALFLVALILTAQARGVPDNDYWDIFSPMIRSLDGLPALSDLYTRSNEHIVAGAKLFYLLNFHLFGGDNFGLSVIAATFSLILALVFSFALALSASSRFEVFVIGMAGSIFVFSPLAAHNFFLGMSGVAWIGANLFTVLSAMIFWQSAERDNPSGYLVAIVLAAVAAQFYSTGLTALCAIGIQGFCSGKTKRLGIAIFVIGIAYVILISVLQHVPAQHAERNFNPIQIGLFCLTFIGGGIVTSETAAIALGTIGIALAFLIVGLHFLRSNERRFQTAFWIAIMAYAVMTSGLAAIGRSNMGGDQAALASRYATIPALFWVGLFGAGFYLFRGADFYRRFWILIFAAAAMSILVNGTPRLAYALARAEGKDLATLALSLGIKDSDLMQYVTPVPDQYYALEDYLKKFNHVPFDGRDFGCPSLGARINVSDQPGNLTGNIDVVSSTQDPQWARVSGWVSDKSDNRPPLLDNDLLTTYRCVAFVDGNGTVVGLGLGGLHRPDVAKALGQVRDDYGWSGYIALQLLPREPTLRSIYAVLGIPSGWAKLQKPVEVGPQF
ncbi:MULTISPECIES: hypothetical protein [Mesorhizobium]|uniref:hypothetical protein n=1 Tax=Mesorhizobium TaxID=68287 RepID=UPI0003CE13E5|nr:MULTISPECIES: hypothetical protein [Mesorhizobium]ESY70031.1 hypothetical protein X742_06815 [Mesorhizobium sp. LNHC232B00]WJI39574.1 hypothetical protein NL534_04730 [Mesorhizobium opportunistum]